MVLGHREGDSKRSNGLTHSIWARARQFPWIRSVLERECFVNLCDCYISDSGFDFEVWNAEICPRE